MEVAVSRGSTELASCLKGLRHGDLADFWTKLSWKIAVANLLHSEHFLSTSKGRYNLNSEKIKQTTVINIDFF